MSELFANLKIIGSDTCKGCQELKDELENFYADEVHFKYKTFKSLPTEERTEIRNFLNAEGLHLPVIQLGNGSYFKGHTDKFLIELRNEL